MNQNLDFLIGRQLSISEPAEVRLKDGRKTTLNPVEYVPQTDCGCSKISLAGDWRVMKWPFKKKERELLSANAEDGSWKTVQQPGKVFYQDPEKQADKYENYNRVSLQHVADEDGAVLRKKVLIPQEWEGKLIRLRFDSIYPCGKVFVNGRELGGHYSGLTPVEFDITGLVAPGREASVALRLYRKHKFVKMDMVRHAAEFAGMAQPASVYAVEKCHISSYHLPSFLNTALDLGTVEGEVVLKNSGNEAAKGILEVSLRELSGRQVSSAVRNVEIRKGAEISCPVKLSIKNPALWNDEFPNLYQVAVSLKIDGQTPQCVSFKTGFRRFEFKNCRPILNGNPVKFRGVNHLTYHPEGGMYTPPDWIRKNLDLMKKANVNAIRTHFLGPRWLADVCDELGIYLLQELPIDWGTNYIHDFEWVGPALQRLMGGILRDRHHPSVMVWSVGNENMPESAKVADWGWSHLKLYDKFAKTLDPNRPTMFPPPGPANAIKGIFEVRVGDIADIHYNFDLVHEYRKTGKIKNPRAWTCEFETMTKEEALKRGWSGTWFSSEYGIFNMMPDLLNAPYCSVISNLKEDPLSGKNSQQAFIDRMKYEWGMLRDDDTCLGGAYFPWLCSGSGSNPWGWVIWAEDNDWGVVTADLLPKQFFWALRVLFSPVSFPERIVVRKGQKSVKFQIKNLYNSIDLKDCKLRTCMGSGFWISAVRWKDIKLSCPPGGTATVEIPIWNKGTQDALDKDIPCALRCYLIDPKGFRPITADILLVPESKDKKSDDNLYVGPDAKES